MTATLARIVRYPVKGIGREELAEVTLAADAPLPGDRAWALLHEGAADTDDWQPRRNFLVVASGPKLAQVTAETGGDSRITLRHPDRPELTFDPETEGTQLVDWAAPLWPDQHSRPKRLVKAPPQGMADNGEAQVALLNLASLRGLSDQLGQTLDIARFRGNLMLDGLDPWEEFEWIGRTLRLGDVTLDVTDRIERCRATEANPATGERDANTLTALEQGWGHRDFGVYATVTAPGRIATGMTVALA